MPSKPAAPPPGINMRMALAGQHLLRGRSLKRALIKGGFAPSTAAKPRANGLTAERCLLEARKLDRSADPGTLLSEARAVAIRQVRAFASLSDDDLRSAIPARTITRLLETAERYHGERPIEAGATDDRSFVRRAMMMADCLRELERRGMLSGHENTDSRNLREPRTIPERPEDEVPPPTAR